VGCGRGDCDAENVAADEESFITRFCVENTTAGKSDADTRSIRLGKVGFSGARVAEKYFYRMSVGGPGKVSARHESESDATCANIARLVNEVEREHEAGLATALRFFGHECLTGARRLLAFLEEGVRSLPQILIYRFAPMKTARGPENLRTELESVI
jgi:hypothetical protein